jgi:hypothetical protein
MVHISELKRSGLRSRVMLGMNHSELKLRQGKFEV